MIFALSPAAAGDPMIFWASESGVEMGEERMLEMKWAGDLKYAGDGAGFAQGGSDDESGADVVGVNDVGANVFDQDPAGFEYCGDLPGMPGGDVEIYGDYGGACFLIFGGEAGGGGGKSDHYFKAQGAQDADLMVDPGCSGGGFDDVQDLHDERTKNNTAKMDVPQSVKVGAGLLKQAGLNSGCGRRI